MPPSAPHEDQVKGMLAETLPHRSLALPLRATVIVAGPAGLAQQLVHGGDL